MFLTLAKLSITSIAVSLGAYSLIHHLVNKPHRHHKPSTTQSEPFQYDTYVTPYELVKIVFFISTLLAPLRFLLCLSLLSFGFTITCLATFGLDLDSPEMYEKPLSRPRTLLLKSIPILCRAIMFIIGFYKVKIKGTPQASILVPKHVSLIDPLAMEWATFGSLAAVAKSDLFNVFLLGRIFKGLQIIPLSRLDQASKKRTKEIIGRFQADDRFPRLMIFPEGTTTRQEFVIKFKKGAFSYGKPVQPVVIKYPYEHFNPSWIVSRPNDFYFLRLFTQFKQSCVVEFLPVHNPTKEEAMDPLVYAENVRKELAKGMNAQLCDLWFEDSVIYSSAAHLKHSLYRKKLKQKRKRSLLPEKYFHLLEDILHEPVEAENPNLEDLRVADVKPIFGDNKTHLREIKFLVTKFIELDEDGDERLSYSDFVRILQLESKKFESLSKKLFDYFDEDNKGYLTVKDVVFGLAYANSCTFSAKKCRLAFILYDWQGNGYIDGVVLKELEFDNLQTIDPGLFQALAKDKTYLINRILSQNETGWNFNILANMQ
eukprot:snap_masked-scaffold_13-processed-gene-3.55-mRNA-1 protein AED:1.00 eAED:1.00 QI:0/-1/0/0/-1/1/1/0/540